MAFPPLSQLTTRASTPGLALFEVFLKPLKEMTSTIPSSYRGRNAHHILNRGVRAVYRLA